MKFSVGEFIFFEFELSQIKKMNAEEVWEVTDGMFGCSGRCLTERCVPLTLRNKVISDHFKYISKKIHDLNSNNLNYPDIHRSLVDMWIKACNTKNEEEIKEIYNQSENLKDKILERCQVMKQEEVCGIKLFR